MEPRAEPPLESPGPPPLRAERRRLKSSGAIQTLKPVRGSRWPLLVSGLLLFALVVLLGPVVLMRWVPPPTTAFMLRSDVKPVSYHWVATDHIAETARKAVVAAEDQKFWTHDGFDVEAIEKAIEHNKRSKRRRGASTISQQTAKNLFLWSGGGYFRKGIEAVYTVLIEMLWSKERILEVYLNIAEFGPGIYGVEAASQTFFGKPASQLAPGEAARLAAILPSPRRWSAKRPGPYVQKRVAWILAQLGYGARNAPVEEPEPPPMEEEGEVYAADEPAPAFGETLATPFTEQPFEAIPVPEGEGEPEPAPASERPADVGPAGEPAAPDAPAAEETAAPP